MKRIIKETLSILGMLSFVCILSCTEYKDNNRDTMDSNDPGMNETDTTDQGMENYNEDTTSIER